LVIREEHVVVDQEQKCADTYSDLELLSLLTLTSKGILRTGAGGKTKPMKAARHERRVKVDIEAEQALKKHERGMYPQAWSAGRMREG